MEAAKPEKKPQQRDEAYAALLMQYLGEGREDCLYRLYELSKVLMDGGMGPGDILALHLKSVEQALAVDSRPLPPEAVLRSLRVILEVISPYEMAFGHYVELKRLALMQEVGLKLISFLDLNALCQFFIDKTVEILRVGEGYLFLKDSATRDLVFRSGKPGPLEVVKAAAGKRCPVSIPLKIGNGLVGEVRLGAVAGGPLGDIERQMTSILANQFTLALERLRLYETLQGQSITDSLTGIYNRRHFYDLLGREVQRARRYPRSFSLLMADIDNFKKINDCYGHLVGDAALKHVAKHLQENFRATDVIARYGGDEFAVLMPEIGQESAFSAAGRLLDKIREHHLEVDGAQLEVTLSIGIADYSAQDLDESDLVRRADMALFQAKAEGRNRICVHA